MVNEPRIMIKVRSIFSLLYQGSNHDIRRDSDGKCEVDLIGNFPLPEKREGGNVSGAENCPKQRITTLSPKKINSDFTCGASKIHAKHKNSTGNEQNREDWQLCGGGEIAIFDIRATMLQVLKTAHRGQE